MSFDRAATTPKRLRRAFQKLAITGFVFAEGLEYDQDTTTVIVSLGDGLEFDTDDQVTLELDEPSGLVVGADGVSVLAGAGLQLAAGGLEAVRTLSWMGI